MARAVNQSIAWIGSFLMSSLVFGLGLSAVFNIHPKHKDLAEHASEDEGSELHGKHGSAKGHSAQSHETETTHAAKTHSTSAEQDSANEHESAASPMNPKHAVAGEDEEKEISAASLKAKASSHSESEPEVPEAKPHH